MSKKTFFTICGALIIIIVGVQIKISQVTQRNVEVGNGSVKSAQTDIKNKISPLPNLPGFMLPPIKKENASDPNVYMSTGALIDAETYYPLWEKNLNKRVPVASTTKIMSSIIVLENYKLSDVIEISPKAAAQIGSDVDLKSGEKLSVDSILKAMLIQSGNDAAYGTAERMGVDNFVNKMNEKARQLNLTNTEFKDPAGLDDTGYSSAFDLSVITAYAMNKAEFAKIVKINEETIYSIDGRISHNLKNSNRLIDGENYLYLPYATGVKTGFTPIAGHCLVSVGEKNGHKLISIVLNTSSYTNEASAIESRKLLEWGFNNFVFS